MDAMRGRVSMTPNELAFALLTYLIIDALVEENT